MSDGIVCFLPLKRSGLEIKNGRGLSITRFSLLLNSWLS